MSARNTCALDWRGSALGRCFPASLEGGVIQRVPCTLGDFRASTAILGTGSQPLDTKESSPSPGPPPELQAEGRAGEGRQPATPRAGEELPHSRSQGSCGQGAFWASLEPGVGGGRSVGQRRRGQQGHLGGPGQGRATDIMPTNREPSKGLQGPSGLTEDKLPGELGWGSSQRLWGRTPSLET